MIFYGLITCEKAEIVTGIKQTSTGRLFKWMVQKI